MQTEERIRRVVESIGDRFIRSDLYERLSENGAFTGDAPLALKSSGDRVAVRFTGEEFASRILAASPYSNIPERAPVETRIKPTPSRIPALVNVVILDAGRGLVPLAKETARTEGAGGRSVDAALGETVLTLTSTDASLHEWGTHLNAPKSVFRDSGVAANTIERFLQRVARKELERQILVGDGTEAGGIRQLTGILNTSGIGTVTLTAETRAEAVARGVETVQNADHFEGPLDVAIGPTDLRELLTEKNAANVYVPVDQILDAVRSFVVTRQLPAGTALVGDFAGSADLYVEGGPMETWALEITDSHASNFVSRVLTVRLSGRLLLDVWAPAGFCRVNGI